MEGLSKIIKGLSRSSTSPHGSSCCLKDSPIPQQYSLSSTRNRSSSNDGLDSPSTPAVVSPQCRRKWSLSSDSIKCEGGVQRADEAPGSSSSTCVFETIHTTTISRQGALPPSSSGPYRQQERSASLPRRLKRRVIWSAKMLHKASKATNSASAAPRTGPQASPSIGSPAAYSLTGCEQQQQLAQQFSPSCSPAAYQPLLTTANASTNGAPSKSSNSTPATQPVPLAMKQLQSQSSSDSTGNSTTAIAANSSSSSNMLPHSSLKSACLQILRSSSAGSSSSSDSSTVCSGYCQPLPLPAQAAAPSFNDDSTLQGRWQGSAAVGQPQSYRQCTFHTDVHEPEIQPWSDGSDEDSLSGHGQSAAAAVALPGRQDHTSSSHDEADCIDVLSLFDNSLPRSDSFTTTCYNTSKGQEVAVVRLGSVITSVFVREPTGEVWECPPDQVIIPETHHSQPASQPATSHNPQPHSAVAAAAAAAAQHSSSSTVLTAEAAAKLYVSMNGGKGSTHTHRRGSAAGSADSSFSSRNSSSSLSPRHHSQCSTGAAGTPVTHLHSATEAQGAGMTTHPTSSRRSHSKGGAHAWGLQSVFSYVRSSFCVWQQQRKLRKQCQAAAYIDAIDDAAHVAMRVAGCHSFVLPRYWPDSVRKAVRQQRRLRVLLTAYKA